MARIGQVKAVVKQAFDERVKTETKNESRVGKLVNIQEELNRETERREGWCFGTDTDL